MEILLPLQAMDVFSRHITEVALLYDTISFIKYDLLAFFTPFIYRLLMEHFVHILFVGKRLYIPVNTSCIYNHLVI